MGHVEIANLLHDRGLILCMIGNQPHRGLGMLFAAKVMQPQRSDFAWDYFTQYLNAFESQLMIEGCTRPVIPMEIVRDAKIFVNDPDFKRLRTYVMHRYDKGDYDNMHGYQTNLK